MIKISVSIIGINRKLMCDEITFLESCLKFIIEIFCKVGIQLKPVNDFRKDVPSSMFDGVVDYASNVARVI